MSIRKVGWKSQGGLFYDSKGDMKKMVEKVNECIEVINKQEQQINELKQKLQEEDINE